MNKLTTTLVIAGLLGTLLTLTGCPGESYEPQVSIYAITAAPPTKMAEVDNSQEQLRTITLSHGVAMAVRCYSYCEDVDYSACDEVEISADHPDVIRVDPVYTLNGDRTRFVLSGVATGTTNVVVTTPCGTRSYLTTVPE